MSAHTPGPWEYLEGEDNCPGHDDPVAGSIVSKDHHIARIWSDGPNPEADARLIAAAPDLLAACIALQMEAAARGCGLRIADEAIAKATS